MKYMMCLFTGLFLSISPGLTQTETPTTHEECVVTANRYETPLSQSGNSVLVLTEEELNAMQVSTVAEALKLCGGIQIMQSGGPGKTASLFIRGSQSRHTLVLIDGIKINEGTSGVANISDLSLANVERIEIVKGPQSALYGSDAMGGVIQIFTRKRTKEGMSTQVSLQAGSRQHRKGTISFSEKKGRFNFAGSYSHYEIGDYSIAPGGTEDPFFSDTAQINLGMDLGDGRGTLSLMARYFDNKTDLDGGWGLPEDDIDRNQSNRSLISSITWKHRFGDSFQHTLSASIMDQDTIGRDNSADIYGYTNQQSRFEYFASFLVNSSIRIASGLSFENQSATNDSVSLDEDVTTQAMFTQATWSFMEDSNITLGARHDDHDLFGGETTWRINFNIKINRMLRSHASFGTGFKAPTINDLFWPESPWAGGNPDLKPETNESWDLGLKGEFNPLWQWDITVFHNHVSDLIAWGPDSSFVWRPFNLRKARLQGVEASISGRISSFLDARAHYTYLNAEEGDTGHQLDYRPENQGGMTLSFLLPRHSRIRLDATHMGRRFESSVAEGFQLDSYQKYDLSMDSRFKNGLKISLHINNLTDADNQDYTGYGVPGRYLFLGLDYTF